MINHSNCDHPRTSSARAKCRRAQANGTSTPKGGATPKEVDLSGSGAAPKGQTPGRKDLECDVCGVERYVARGTDPVDGILKYVGEHCFYYIKHAEDKVFVD